MSHPQVAVVRVRVSYRAQEGAQLQERETPFAFTVTDEQRRLIQWYLEEYLLYPWGVFPHPRAAG